MRSLPTALLLGLALLPTSLFAQTYTELGTGGSATLSSDGSSASWSHTGFQFLAKWNPSEGWFLFASGTPAGLSADGDWLWQRGFLATAFHQPVYLKDLSTWVEVPFGDGSSPALSVDVADSGAVAIQVLDSQSPGSVQARVMDTQGTDLGVVGQSLDYQHPVVISRDATTVGGFVAEGPSFFGYGKTSWRLWSGGGVVAGSSTFDNSRVTALSIDGSRAALVGDGGGFVSGRAYLFDSGMTEPVLLEGGLDVTTSEVTAMSADGSILVGFGSTPEHDQIGLVWTEPGGWIYAGDYLACRGIDVPSGSTVRRVFDLSSDGNTLLGGLGPVNTVFHAEMGPGQPFGWQDPSTSPVLLCGGGSTSIGTTFLAEHTGIPGPVVVTGFSLGPDEIPFGANSVVLNQNLVIPPLAVTPAVGGDASLSIPISNLSGLIGLSLYLQSGAPDASSPSGWRLSNGLRLTFTP